jgi:hypothetical protein
VGARVGAGVGAGVGLSVGRAVGDAVGQGEGAAVGDSVGLADGLGDGAFVGDGVGPGVGLDVGGVGAFVGEGVGDSVGITPYEPQTADAFNAMTEGQWLQMHLHFSPASLVRCAPNRLQRWNAPFFSRWLCTTPTWKLCALVCVTVALKAPCPPDSAEYEDTARYTVCALRTMRSTVEWWSPYGHENEAAVALLSSSQPSGTH